MDDIMWCEDGGRMSRTGLDALTLANSLRTMAGDGSLEWVAGPIRASVLLDIVDMLDKTTELRDERERLFQANVEKNREILSLLIRNRELKELLLESFILVKNDEPRLVSDRMAKRMRELGIEMEE